MDTDRKVRALKPKIRLELDDYVTALAWTSDNAHVAVGTAAGTLYWIDAVALQVTGQVKAHRGGVCQVVAASAKGKVFSGGQDGQLKSWTAGQEGPDLELTLGKHWVEHIVSGGGSERNLLAAAAGKTVFFLTPEGKETRPKVELESTVSGLAWHHQAGMLLTSSYGGLQVFGVKKGTPQALKKYEWKGAFWCCSWSPEGKWAAGATQEKAVHIWEADTAEHLHMPGYPAKVKSMHWTRNGKWLITAAGMDLLLWDCSGEGPCGRQPKFLAAHASTVGVCAVQHEGTLFASADESGRMILWDADLPEEAGLIAAFPGESEIGACVWSPDDKVLAVGCADGSFFLF